MPDQIRVKVFEIVGSSLCVSSDDGQRVHDQVAKALKEGYQVELSFANVEGLTSAFLNTAIGQLYSKFTDDQIKKSLRVSDMTPEDLALLKRVVDTAKEYFKNPSRINNARNTILGDDEKM